MARRRQQCHQATSEGAVAAAPLGLIAVRFPGNPIAVNRSSGRPFNFRRQLMPPEKPKKRCFARQHNPDLGGTLWRGCREGNHLKLLFEAAA
jgi:hypothetical protein